VFINGSQIFNIENQFKITLLNGSWGNPMNLDIKASNNYPKNDYAKQIREVLEYAGSEKGMHDLAFLYNLKKRSPAKTT